MVCNLQDGGRLPDILCNFANLTRPKTFSPTIKFYIVHRTRSQMQFNFSGNIFILLTESKRFQKPVLDGALFLVSHKYHV